ncbi:YdbL family protein [Sphingomonas sp. BN140010]|uniref:YdbL family protein n=1 Tax=Sphingomonas arvum TaxID=2992113 RepID=A0ABT3JDH2_9SPHN|nr:YdbL family protein [Sphingomonas sp. BN140010]MCW3796841.1 YdbL family protein [Sphingomonas sp. BN140010]
MRLAVLGAALVAAPLAAQVGPAALLEARAQGVVGERYDGYLGYAREPGSNAARVQTEAVNIRRRALYSSFASRRGVSPQEVGITAGCTLLGRVQAGESYMLSDGMWRRRAAGEEAPVPDYCTGG